ncbi:MAG: hypothetical protein DI628_02150 [Blastochloris viridis]|uniref:Transglutaminase-like domain-containing protein n=1 Tax=Blastochloris viridis TaxID=1079 RepID=A0A6N4R328_BLAVI|nr:MAG: hypothetical protein DI628_02150 [Blastochloris viridis]
MSPHARTIFSFFAASALAVAAYAPAYAQNAMGNGFQTAARGGWQEYAYSYSNRIGEPQRLFFRLSADDISRGGAEFRDWDDVAAQNAAVQAVQVRARELETPNLKAEITPMRNGMNIRLMGRGGASDAKQLHDFRDALDQTYTTSLQRYAKQNYYRATMEGANRATIQPDHPAIAVRYTKAMGPVAKAIMEQVPGASESPRAFINAALTWLQSIPYDTLQNRSTSNGAGFQTPYGLIGNNLGDCDTKATALAALIRAAYPTIPLAIVYVPEHAFLGIGLPQTKEDFALRTEQGTFILADATGPGLTPLGYIDPRTQSKTGGVRTSILLVP